MLVVRAHATWLSLAGVLACAPADHASQPRVVTTTIRQYESAPRLMLADSQVLCGLAPAPECPFRNIVVAAASEDGRALLGDYRSQLYLYREPGSPPVPIGRLGKGPGEYTAVIAAGFHRDGFSLFDIEQLRVVRYTPGQAASTSALVVQPPPVVYGALFEHEQLYMLSVPPGSRRGRDVQATIYALPVEGGRPIPRGWALMPPLVVGESDLLPVRPFFEPKPLWAVGPDGAFAVGDGARLDFAIQYADTSRSYRLRAEVPTLPITERDIQVRRAEAQGFGLSPLMRTQYEAQLREALKHTGKVFPEATSLAFLSDGSLLIRGASPPTLPQVDWLLFSRAGALQGILPLSAGARIIGGTSSHLLIAEDRDDIASAAWYALTASP